MKIRFLGTGAADWVLCENPNDGNYRFLSSAMIDGVLIIDPGPEVFKSAEKFGIDLSNVKYIINTHSHSDHYSAETVEKLCSAGAEFIRFAVGEQKTLGEYSISAYEGNHGTATDTVHFIIEKDGKRIFYGLDSAWLLYPEVAAIKKNGVDMAVLDGTIGNVDGDYRIFEHNNLNMVREMKKTLEPFVKTFVISHMAYTLHASHNELEAEMKECGIIAAFDNLELEI